MENDKKIKYSIIIPVRNCRPYIQATIESVVSQNYDNYEIIISDNNSTDGTKEFLRRYELNSRIKVVYTPDLLVLSDHFDWAQTHASGEWQIFLGGDDGLQPYFFRLADKLTELAMKKKIRAITSKRAYFFWKNCASNYSYTAVNYYAAEKITVENCNKQIFKYLYGKRECGYFDLPQMYATSLFHFSLLQDIRLQQECVLLSLPFYPQDMQLAALSLSVEDVFLESHIPLGWVGTSSKELLYTLRKEHENLNVFYTDIYPHELGMWDILLQKAKLWNPAIYKKLSSPFFKIKLFAYALLSIQYRNKYSGYSVEPIFMYMKNNKIPVRTVIIISRLIVFFELLVRYFLKFIFFPWRCVRYILKRIPFVKKCFINKTSIKNNVNLYVSWNDDPNMTMQKASEMVMDLINKNINLEELKI